jgi:hypothetical protein
MSLATLTSKELSRIQELIEQKEVWVQQIAQINSQLEAIESGVSAPAYASGAGSRATLSPRPRKAAATRPSRGKRGKTARGELKATVIAELKAAGKEGVRIKDLATRLGTNYGNMSAFFGSTGKKIREIKKVGRGHYTWTGK